MRDRDALQQRLAAIAGDAFVCADPSANAPFAVDGVVPALTVQPGTQDEVSTVVAACAAAGAALVPWGGGTAMGAGNPPKRLDVVVRLDRLDRVVEYDAANLCLTVEAGLTLARLQALVSAEGQLLPLDPPAGDRATLGGLVAADQSGPCRLLHGTLRDWVLGLRVVLPDGERIRCGGRVIKNVTGYDMNKIFLRSFGTLGIVTEVTLKLLPAPVARATVAAAFAELQSAAAVVDDLKASFLLPEALDLLDPAAFARVAPALGCEPEPAFLLAAAFAGSAETVARQVRDAEAMMAARDGTVRILRGDASARAWAALANVLAGAPAIRCRIAVPIGRTAALVEAVCARAAGCGAVVAAHAASGIVRAELGSGDAVGVLAALREDARREGGSLVLLEAPPSLKARLDAWGPPGSGLAVMRRIKAEFDPAGVCSPGRFLGGI